MLLGTPSETPPYGEGTVTNPFADLVISCLTLLDFNSRVIARVALKSHQERERERNEMRFLAIF